MLGGYDSAIRALRALATIPLLLTYLTEGCSGSTPTSVPGPQANPTIINGTALIGQLDQANVVLQSPDGQVFLRSVTDGDGRFGPLLVDGQYTGPLELRIEGTASTTYFCDVRSGCLHPDGTFLETGARLPFTGTMRLVLESPAQGARGVTVTPFSHIAAVRAEALGGLTVANIATANNEVQDLVRELVVVLDPRARMNLPYYRYPWFNLTVAPDEVLQGNDRIGALISLINSSLHKTGIISSSDPDLSAEEMLQYLSAGFASDGRFALTSGTKEVVSLERLQKGLVGMTVDWHFYGELLFRSSLVQAWGEALGTEFRVLFERAREYIQRVPRIDSTALGDMYYQIGNDTLGNGPLGTTQLILPEGVSADRVSVYFDDPNLRVELREEPAGLFADFYLPMEAITPGDSFFTPVQFLDSEGEVRSLFGELIISFRSLTPLEATIEGAQDLYERSLVDLRVVPNRRTEITSVVWEQIDGPTLSLSGENSHTLGVYVRNLSADATATLRASVTDALGGVTNVEVTLNLLAYPEVDTLALADDGLRSCFESSYAGQSLRDVGDISSLDCSGTSVSRFDGLGSLLNLTTLDLSGGGAGIDFEEISRLAGLNRLILGGQSLLACADVAEFVSGNPDVQVIGGEDCGTETFLKLYEAAADIVVSPDRSRLFVSIPADKNLLIVDMQTMRVASRLDVPGKPYGMAFSLDGTRLFVALAESNAVGVIQLSDFSMSTINLGDAPGDNQTHDVAEVSRDRLLVTTGLDFGGPRYAVEVRLDQGNAVRRVATEQQIRSIPMIEVDREAGFAYVSEGTSQLFKLDLGQPDVPVVLSDQVSIFGAHLPTLGANGTRIHVASGQILDTETLTEALEITERGPGAVGGADERLFVVAGGTPFTRHLAVFDWDDPNPLATAAASCGGIGVGKLVVLDERGSEFAWLSEDKDQLCAFVQRPPGVLDESPLLAVRDPQLNACVRDTAASGGFTQPFEIPGLDCSGYPGVEDLAGLEEFNGLTTLTIDGRFFDIEAFRWLWRLRDLRLINNSQLADLHPLVDRSRLELLDLSGSENVSCGEIGRIRSEGKTVIDSGCVVEERLALGGVASDSVLTADGSLLFVAVPTLQEIVVVEMAGFREQRRISLPARPQKIALSIDEGELLVALSDLGSVAFVDLDDDSVSVTDVSSALRTSSTYAVAEVEPDVVLVTGRPDGFERPYLVRLDRSDGSQVRVAGEQEFLQTPRIVLDRVRGLAYIAEGNSDYIYKIDIVDPVNPIVQQTDRPFSGASDALAISQDGMQLFAGDGHRIETVSFTHTGTFDRGTAVPQTNGQLAIALRSRGSAQRATVRYVSLQTMITLGQRHSSCPAPRNGWDELDIHSSPEGLIVVSEALVCRVPSSAP